MKGRGAVLAALAVAGLAAIAVLGLGTAQTAKGNPPNSPTSNCKLDNGVKHVVYLIFDNVHFLRDNPNVPSDVEQMPNLLNFIRGQRHAAHERPHGPDLTHGERDSDQPHRRVLRSPRAGGLELVPLLPGGRFDGVVDLVQVLDGPDRRRQRAAHRPELQHGQRRQWHAKNTPAPWVPYTRAGCDLGATALANVVLENTGTGPNGDMTKVFGAGSPEWNEALASNAAPRTRRRGTSRRPTSSGSRSTAPRAEGICAGNSHARPDLLPDEPGGYNGFQGLFGAKYVNPGDQRRAATV